MSQKSKQDLAMLMFIDAHLDLFGMLNAADLMRTFGVHRSRASDLIRIYKEAKPANLRYDTTAKCYKKSFTFRPEFLKTSASEYLKCVDTMYPADNDE